MRVVVFGSTGGVGQQLCRVLLARGHQPVAVTRRDPPAGLSDCELRRGSVLDADVVRHAVRGCDAALSALGPKRVAPGNPWSRLAGPPDFAERSAAVLTAALRAEGIQRVIAVSAAGIGAREWHPMLSLLRATSTLGPMYRDLIRMEAVYAGSGLDWQCVRPVVLTHGAGRGQARVVEGFGLFATLARADLAAWMVDQLHVDPPRPRTPVLRG